MKEEKMIYAGSTMFHECSAEDHARCKAIDLIDEVKGLYAACECSCHEAVECAGARDSHDVTEARRNEFFATIEALAKAQAIGLGGKP